MPDLGIQDLLLKIVLIFLIVFSNRYIQYFFLYFDQISWMIFQTITQVRIPIKSAKQTTTPHPICIDPTTPAVPIRWLSPIWDIFFFQNI